MSQILNLSSGPHIRDRRSTALIMYIVVLTLLPAAAVGVWVHGLKALWVILASVIAAVGTEFIYDKLMGKPDTWRDALEEVKRHVDFNEVGAVPKGVLSNQFHGGWNRN